MGKPKYVAFFDGACGPKNPGGRMGFGVVIFDEHNKIYQTSGFRPKSPDNSNNLAEYLGFSAILDWCENNMACDERILVCGDSNLVIKQMFGRWRIKYGAYADLARIAKLRRERFTAMSGRWIPREQNRICDRLSKRG